MKKYIVLILIFWHFIANAQPAFVQEGDYPFECTGSSCVISFDSNVTAGNLVVVSIRTDNNNAGVTSVTGPGSQSCTQAVEVLTGTSFYVELWYCANSPGGSKNVTVNLPADNGNRMCMAEYSGVATVSPLHDSVSNASTGDTTDAGDIVTTEQNVLIHLFAGVDGYDEFYSNATPVSGFTQHDMGTGPSAPDKYAQAHRVVSNTGTYDAYFTGAGSGETYGAAAAAFKSSSSGPTNSSISGSVSISN